MDNLTQPPFPKDSWVRQSLDNLRDDITEIELERIKAGYSSKIVEVIDPGFGISSPTPIDGLIDITYQCNDRYPKKRTDWVVPPCSGFQRGEHTHGALYGPHIIQFPDDCKHCKKSKYKEHSNHTYESIGYEIVNWEKFELYAD